MYATLAALVVVAAGAEPFDKTLIRKCMLLPRMELASGGSCSNGLLVIPDGNAYLSEEIIAEERAAHAEPENPEHYRKLGDLYERAQDSKKSDAANDRAAELYRARLTQHPEDGLARARSIEVRHWRGSSVELDAELRKAVETSPRQWECWTIRCRYLIYKSLSLLLGDLSNGGFGPAGVVARVRDGTITESRFQAAQSVFNEALECLDRAAMAGPTASDVFALKVETAAPRAAFVWSLQAMQGDRPAGSILRSLTQEHVPDLWKAAALDSHPSRFLGGAAFLELSSALDKVKMKPVGLDSIPSLSGDTRKAIRGAISRLRELAVSGDLQSRTDAAEALAEICILSGENAGAEECLHQILQRDPSLEGAWDFLTQLHRRKLGHEQEVLSVCRERLRYKDSARNRFMLAKALDETHQPDEACKILEEAVHRDPDDFECNLGLAALLMRTDNAADLKRAGQILKKVEPVGLRQPTPDRCRNYTVLWFAFLALSDQLDALRQMASELKESGMSDDRLTALVDIIGSEMLLPPVPGSQIQPVSGNSK